jgi:hypothetical protein
MLSGDALASLSELTLAGAQFSLAAHARDQEQDRDEHDRDHHDGDDQSGGHFSTSR